MCVCVCVCGVCVCVCVCVCARADWINVIFALTSTGSFHSEPCCVKTNMSI